MKVIMIRLMLLLLGLYAGQAMAQQVKGVIKDQTGSPLPGVTVQVVGTSLGVSSDIDGNFTIKVDDAKKAVLRFSFVGMKTQEVNVAGKSHLEVVLQDATKALDEVVVIGYGSVKRRDVTGSVVSVQAKDLAAVPVASAIEAMSGKMAGVQITTTEGDPDAEVKIRVRGGGSLTQSNDPLFIVDGFPVSSISDISPSEIESIDVLKDASSTAIYGARGANGVVIVTTKGGSQGRVRVNYNMYYGFKKIAKTLDVLDSYDFVNLQYELAALNDKLEDKYEPYFGKYADMDMYAGMPENDWQDQIFGRVGSTFNHNLNISGGSDKIKFSFGYSHIDDEAIMLNSDFKRDNANLKMNYKPTKKITFDFTARYSDTKVNGSGANAQTDKGTSSDSRLKHAVIYRPIPVKGVNPDTDIEEEISDLTTPTVAVADNDRQRSRKTYNIGGGFSWEIIKNLKVRTEFGLDDYRNDDSRFYGKTTYYSTAGNTVATTLRGLPIIVLSNTYRKTFRNTNTLSYELKNLNDQHNFSILLGEEQIKISSKVLTSEVQGFPEFFDSDMAFKFTEQGTPYSVNNFYNPDDKLLSFFARVNYDYLGRYLLTATFRADGSSKFGDGNKWGYFPSVAVGWRLSDEEFLKADWLDNLKLRFSYGMAGNNNIPSGQMSKVFSSSTTGNLNITDNYWTAGSSLENSDLKWETTYTRNLGLDFAVFQSRLNGSLEFYLNNTKDLLMKTKVTGSGYASQYRNMGETENKGIEFSLNWTAVDKENFGLNLAFNIGFNRNKIKSLGGMDPYTEYSEWASSDIVGDFYVEKGGSVGQMYGYKTAGRYEVSDFQGYDATTKKWVLKEGIVDCSPLVGSVRPGSLKLENIDELSVIGNANPKHTGGFSLNARAYGFDLAANFTWSYGNDIYNANKIMFTTSDQKYYQNMTTEMASGKRWTNLNPDGSICNDPAQLEAMNRNTTMWSPDIDRLIFHSWAVEDGSFLRLNTLSVGYTLPKSILRKLHVDNLRIYATGYNVFCLTDYSGYDPEVDTRRSNPLTPGVDFSAYPKSRQIVFGLNLSF